MRYVILAIGSVFLWQSTYAVANFQDQAFRGRIAYSADGNFNDEDDWASSPMALAIFSHFGVSDRLVHFDYNCILPKSDPIWESEHKKGIMGAISHFGYDASIFYDCQKELNAAVKSITNAINSSSAEDPLFYILAGPMEVPFLGIAKSDPEKRKYVYCISHNNWNDGYASGDLVDHNKRDVIPTGVTWIQITDQNRRLTTGPFGRPSTEEEWRPWHWLRDAKNPKLKFLWDRMVASTRADCSDSGMAYFLMSGDEHATIEKLKSLLLEGAVPDPLFHRNQVRLEAENFTVLEKCEIVYKNDRTASQRISVQTKGGSSLLKLNIKEPYMIGSGRYDLTLRYQDVTASTAMTLLINGFEVGHLPPQSATQGWHSWTLPNVLVSLHDLVEIRIDGEKSQATQVDYLQLNRRVPFEVASSSHLDDPVALPGQIIVAGTNPEFLKYNGGGPAFLSGPDNPEDFLFRGELKEDGTRSGGGQEEMIRKLARSGVNAFHCQMFRMQRCNIKNEGDDAHGPFIDHDPSRGLNQQVLDQWDGWLALFEEAGIIVHLEF